VGFYRARFYKYAAPTALPEAGNTLKSNGLTIKANYLSFYDKKDLTNGIEGFILAP